MYSATDQSAPTTATASAVTTPCLLLAAPSWAAGAAVPLLLVPPSARSGTGVSTKQAGNRMHCFIQLVVVVVCVCVLCVC